MMTGKQIIQRELTAAVNKENAAYRAWFYTRNVSEEESFLLWKRFDSATATVRALEIILARK